MIMVALGRCRRSNRPASPWCSDGANIPDTDRFDFFVVPFGRTTMHRARPGRELEPRSAAVRRALERRLTRRASLEPTYSPAARIADRAVRML